MPKWPGAAFFQLISKMHDVHKHAEGRYQETEYNFKGSQSRTPDEESHL